MKNEITIRDIAGFCPEEAVWKMMADVSGVLLKETNGAVIHPDAILVDGDTFFLENRTTPDSTFLAPEQESSQKPDTEQMVWALGATAYFMATGHIIFGGFGGQYQRQHPAVALPMLSKSMYELTPVLHRCLQQKPTERIRLEELKGLADNGLVACNKRTRESHVQKMQELTHIAKCQGERWPEQMIET
jgi:hypothetical protein